MTTPTQDNNQTLLLVRQVVEDIIHLIKLMPSEEEAREYFILAMTFIGFNHSNIDLIIKSNPYLSGLFTPPDYPLTKG